MKNKLILGDCLFNPIINYWIDLYFASLLELHYSPYKAFVNSSKMDFMVWPNAKIVSDLQNTNLCQIK
jgi:hypothetical protein